MIISHRPENFEYIDIAALFMPCSFYLLSWNNVDVGLYLYAPWQTRKIDVPGRGRYVI